MATPTVDKIKYVFFGSPRFASIIIERLINAGHAPKAVVCNPDRPAGRKKIITPPPVKSLILEHKIWSAIKILQPETLFPFPFPLSSLKADFAIVASYSKIIPKEILDIFPLGAIGVHPSLLPKYRGATPIQTAILNGDKETGATLYMMDEKLDHGPILKNVKCKMAEGETYESLHNKLAELGAELLIETLPKFIKGEIKSIAQNESEATFTKKFSAQDAFLNFDDLDKAQHCGGLIAKEIDRKIRALNPEPGTFTLRPSSAKLQTGEQVQGESKRVKILKAVLCDDGRLVLKKIQIEGKKPVEI